MFGVLFELECYSSCLHRKTCLNSTGLSLLYKESELFFRVLINLNLFVCCSSRLKNVLFSEV